MSLDGLVGYCYHVRRPVPIPSVGHVTVGVIISEVTGFSGQDVLLEFRLDLAYDFCLVLQFLELGAPAQVFPPKSFFLGGNPSFFEAQKNTKKTDRRGTKRGPFLTQ